ncbi:hypothetical protein [Paenibacillus sp.]|uniref:hypothetical protein n=1 Tax=Paenibacillus sp. TaxID=58172 RepID=UPI002D71D4E8|nr:hypothetical protein [Paenibacillus sp.]HZG86162.1 hypothetical protein [Paenibacillus sp.]
MPTVRKKITAKEKAVVANVLLKSFSPNELRTFAEIAKDGITVEEKKATRGMFIERLSEEEYNRLIAIAAKYGLSQGKQYKDVIQEETAEGTP